MKVRLLTYFGLAWYADRLKQSQFTTFKQEAEAESKARSALLTLPNRSSDLVLIVRLERILRGEEVQQALEPYLHAEVRSVGECIVLYFCSIIRIGLDARLMHVDES